MKTRKIKSLIYIFSSVMVLGLALLSFDNASVFEQTSSTPTVVPAGTPGTTPENTPVATSTPLSTPSPTPTPSLAQLNAAIAIQPATDETGVMLTDEITAYLNERYSDEELNVKEISNVTCYYKEGLSYADYIVYAVYDIKYNESTVPIPTLDEYCISIENDVITIYPEPLDSNVKKALLLSRASESVCELYIKETIRRYMNAKLAYDEVILSELVTDSSSININDITTEMQYYEEYTNQSYLIHKCPEEITEFDFIVYVSTDVKIVTVSTPVPGAYEYIIKLDKNNYPKIFSGSVSDASGAYHAAFRESEEYMNCYNDVSKRFEETLHSDPDLAKMIEVIINATNETD